MGDNKERRFCFAHVGARLDVSKLSALHIACASGTQVAGGVQYTSLTLQHDHGRRAAQLKGVVAAYNKTADVPVAPVVVPPHTDSVLAFGLLDPHSNAIVARIEADQKDPSCYWEWSEGGSAAPRCTLWLAAMVRTDLGLEVTSKEAQAAEDDLNRVYLRDLNKTPDAAGRYDEADRAFLLGVLRRHFETRLSFSIAPPRFDRTKEQITAGLADGWMGDCLPAAAPPVERATYKQDPTQRKRITVQATGPIPPIVAAYLRAALPAWQGPRHSVRSRDVAFALNGDRHHGPYGSMSVCGLLGALVASGAADLFRVERGEMEFVFDVEKARRAVEQ